MTVKPHDWKRVLWLTLKLVHEPEFYGSVNLNKVANEAFAVKANAVRTYVNCVTFEAKNRCARAMYQMVYLDNCISCEAYMI